MSRKQVCRALVAACAFALSAQAFAQDVLIRNATVLSLIHI